MYTSSTLTTRINRSKFSLKKRNQVYFSHSPKSITLTIMLAVTATWSSTTFAKPGWLQSLEANCNAGQAQDCLNAGSAYLRGEFDNKKTGKDRAQAKKYIKEGLVVGEKNCKRNSLHDCYIIGVVYFEGELTPADFTKGLEYLQKSCRGGYKEACIWLENSGLRMR